MSVEISRRAINEQMRPRYAGLKVLSMIAASLFLLIVAGTWSVDSMFTMSACLLALPFVSIIICRIWLSGLQCERGPIHPMTEGDTGEITLALSQRFFTDLTVHVWDVLPNGLRSDPLMPAEVVLTGKSMEFRYGLNGRKRGVYEIGPLQVGIHDPLGVRGAIRRFGQSAQLVVYPKALELTDWMLASGDGPLSPAAQVAIRAVTASGIDFQGTRKYYPGDDLRRVHWKSAARAGELIVSEYQEESTPGDVIVALDTEIGSDVDGGEETTLDYGVRVAAYIAKSALDNGSRISLLSAAGKVNAEGDHQLPVVLEHLARLRADSKESLAGVLTSSLPAPGSTVVVISSKVDGNLREAARRLLQSGVNMAQVYVIPETFDERLTSAGRLDALVEPDIPCWRVSKGDGHGD
jgi:uncharacterized protein (DUF58 family)